jgi:hypothetical protein
MRIRWILLFVTFGASLVGCGTSTPYFLIESRLIENDRRVEAPDVTETPQFVASQGSVATVGLQPPDVCADQGVSTGDGASQLTLGVLRTRCGVEMAELERALARAGYHVVSWGAVQQMAKQQDKPLLESARELGIDVLIQVNALERVQVRPGRDSRFERRFFHATREGVRAEPAFVEPIRARDFESLLKRRESSLANGKRVGATINVSAVRVETGATIWFYEWTQVDIDESEPRIEILVDCAESNCHEVPRLRPVSAGGPVEGSISGISVAGDPANEFQAIFHDLVRSLVTDLAERFAGHRS